MLDLLVLVVLLTASFPQHFFSLFTFTTNTKEGTGIKQVETKAIIVKYGHEYFSTSSRLHLPGTCPSASQAKYCSKAITNSFMWVPNTVEYNVATMP